jgi:protein-S-isoprenylcysteine O-methyltransferase Ste14
MTDASGEAIPLLFSLLLRIPVPWVFVLTYLLGVVLEAVWPVQTAAATKANLVSLSGALTFSVGAVVAGWGLVTFRKARTTTVPGRTSAQLVTWGPYRFSRNPMYVGLVIAYFGEAMILRQVWPVVLLPLTVAYVNWVVIPLEQRKLEEVFGDEYARYQARVRPWL